MILSKYVDKIKNGKKREVILAGKQINKILNSDNKNLRNQLIDEYIGQLENFENMSSEENQLAFISNLRLIFVETAAKKKKFKIYLDFILKQIQHPSKRIRCGISKICLRLAAYLRLGERDYLNKSEIDELEISNNIKLFGELVDSLEELNGLYRNSEQSVLKSEIQKNISQLIIDLTDGEYRQNIYGQYKMDKMGFTRLDDSNEIQMPKWMDCVWRRIPCGKESCPICGKIKKDWNKHLAAGDDPNDLEIVFDGLKENWSEALVMKKKDLAEPIVLDKIGKISEPPDPEKFVLYIKVKKWRDGVYEIMEDCARADFNWAKGEADLDLLWYADVLLAKIYRQLCNRWHSERGEVYGNIDYDYTKYVLEECLKILKLSLNVMANLNIGHNNQMRLALLYISGVEKEILEI